MSDALDTLQALLAPADIRINGDRPWDMEIVDSRCVSRILAGGSLALGESYMDGDWRVYRLDMFFERLLKLQLPAGVREPRRLWAVVKSALVNPQCLHRSRRVAEVHYDLGNDFFQAMLDPYMQYTCGYWRQAQTLAAAQEAKLDLVCRKLQLRPGERVLELGCGWGGFARFAAERYGVEVVGYNISREQVGFARRFCAGLPVEIRHADYRTAEGTFDKLISIGMCEHVGSRNYRKFLKMQRARLKPDGLALLHTIGCLQTKRTSDPWFSKYIFPGGQLPSLVQLAVAAEGLFVVEDVHNIGADYDPTLMAWFRNFTDRWDRFSERYGDRIFRMWSYYLLSCAGAFRARDIQLWQIVLSPQGMEGGYESVR